MHPFLLRSGYIAASALACAVMLEILLNPGPAIHTNMNAFIALKKSQPVKNMDERRTLIAAGDIMLSRFTDTVIRREGSVDYPYEEVRGALQTSDIAFANLEHPVGSGAWQAQGHLSFRADQAMLSGLKRSGIDILSIANNHMSDAGVGGIAETIEHLDNYGFMHTGAGVNEGEARRPVIIDIRGKRFAFLAYGDERFSNQVKFAGEQREGIAKADLDTIKADIAAAKVVADIVIVSLHSGIEYLEEPDRIQKSLLDGIADSGADLVLGHHPHVIQPLYEKGDSWVISSLGNLIFDQMWAEHVRRGMMLRFFFDGNDIAEIEALPIQMHNFAQPQLAQGEAKREALLSLAHPLSAATEIEWRGVGTIPALSLRAMPLQEKAQPSFTIEKTLHGDLNGDGHDEIYQLKGGRLFISDENFPIWESNAQWWVQDAFLADIDGQDAEELVLSVWKSGNFGSSKPFWVKENDDSIRHHVFVFSFADGTVQPIWQSSNLPHPNCEMAFEDLEGDGIDELIALEGEYESDGSCIASHVAIWKWGSWGFENEWRSEAGTYWNVRTEKSKTGPIVVVNGEADY